MAERLEKNWGYKESPETIWWNSLYSRKGRAGKMEIWRWPCLKHSVPVCFAAFSFFVLLVSSSKSPLGIHPLGIQFPNSFHHFVIINLIEFVNKWIDAKYFAAEVIKCKDGSKSFTRDRLNDNFCDCLDGTDEPGILFYWNRIYSSYCLIQLLGFDPLVSFHP